MTNSAILRELGVGRHGKGWRVRLVFDGFGRYSESGFTTERAAVMRALELAELRDAGEPPPVKRRGATLAHAAEALLVRKRVGGKRGPLTKAGLAYWQRSLKPWLEGPFADVPLERLRREPLEDALLTRAAVSSTSARNERQALLAALGYAAARGERFDLAILQIGPIPVDGKRRRRSLSVDELEHFAEHVVDYARRLVLLQGTVGNRVGELFDARPEHVDLDASTLFVPDPKEGRPKTIPLTPEELELMREQLGGLHAVDASSSTAGCPTMPRGSERLFPTKTGLAWRHGQFDRLVWQKAVKSAAAAWRLERGLDERAATPFEWYDDDGARRTITTHDLRSTAVTLMRDAGLTREDAADRIGHADGGKLIAAVYDQGDKAARVGRALAVTAPAGLRAALSEPVGRRANSHAASTGSGSGRLS